MTKNYIRHQEISAFGDQCLELHISNDCRTCIQFESRVTKILPTQADNTTLNQVVTYTETSMEASGLFKIEFYGSHLFISIFANDLNGFTFYIVFEDRIQAARITNLPKDVWTYADIRICKLQEMS